MWEFHDSFIVKSNNNILLDGKNIYLGQEATQEVEPIVLGKQLVTVLEKKNYLYRSL